MKNEIIHLSPSQERHLKASLYIFEKSIRKSKRLLEEKDFKGFIFKSSNTLTENQQLQVRNKLDEALKKLNSVVKTIGLKPEEEDVAQIINSEISIGWENLIECLSDHFKGYGKIETNSALKLDTEIKPLIEISNEIFKLSSDVRKKKMVRSEEKQQ